MESARPASDEPTIEVTEATGAQTVVLRGPWNLRGLRRVAGPLRARLGALVADPRLSWDLRDVSSLDSAGAFVLWTSFGAAPPARLAVRAEHRALLDRWGERPAPATIAPPPRPSLPGRLVTVTQEVVGQQLDLLRLVGDVALDLLGALRHPRRAPWREISQTLHEAGGRALGITGLVGLLIGIVLAYLSSLQLRSLGAQAYIVDILGLGIVRELGPLLAAIIVAGRSGSAMTAQLGVMRVTQELDALAALGVSHTQRLVLPKVVALAVALPLLTVWTDLVALIGGIISAAITLHIGPRQFAAALPQAVPVVNHVIGLGKAAVFGLLIALTACHFGLRIKPNTRSLSRETTNAVVTAITMVILVDAVFAVLLQGVGTR